MVDLFLGFIFYDAEDIESGEDRVAEVDVVFEGFVRTIVSADWIGCGDY